MADSDFPVLEVWEELARLCEVNLHPTLNVKVIKGSFASQPTPGIANMIPGIWINATPTLVNDEVEMPRVFQQQINFRLIYLRRMQENENPTVETAEDAVTIAQMINDNFTLPSASMPDNCQVLWTKVKTIEFEPQEDDLIATLAADVRAVAVQVEVTVRVRAR